MSQEFISHDGADSNGVRAEVVVVKGNGKIVDITLGNKDKSAQISFIEPNLKQPIKGWCNVGTELYNEAVRVKETGEEVAYRIEIQRKNFIPRETPMSKVRPKGDMITASKNCVRILASINSIVSEEAVTHPSEDVASSFGRHKATGTETTPVQVSPVDEVKIVEALKTLAASNATSEVKTAAIGAAVANGVNVETVLALFTIPAVEAVQPEVKEFHSVEGKPWQEWNSDGRANLGHAKYVAGVSVETFTRKQLHNVGFQNEALEDGTKFFTQLVLSIADRVQQKVYGEGFRADRSADSHTRIRSIIFDIVENYAPFPTAATVNAKETVNAWVKEVGNTAYSRFLTAVEASEAETSFTTALPDSIYGQKQAV